MTATAVLPDRGEIHDLALRKMSAVLGPERAGQLLQQLLPDGGRELRTADDLFRFAAELSKLGGFEGAVGAMLSVAAVMRGAAGARG